jgi:hypothetical protein
VTEIPDAKRCRRCGTLNSWRKSDCALCGKSLPRLGLDETVPDGRAPAQSPVGHQPAQLVVLPDVKAQNVFQRSDDGWEPFDPAACITYVLAEMQGGPALAHLKLPDGRWVEQEGRLAPGWVTRRVQMPDGPLWSEVQSYVPDAYHARYSEIHAPPAIPPVADLYVTLAGLRRPLWEVERLHRVGGFRGREWQGNYPAVIHRELIDCLEDTNGCPGYKALKDFLQIELDEHFASETVDGVIHEIAGQLGKPVEEIERLTVVEAVAILNERAVDGGGRSEPVQGTQRTAAALALGKPTLSPGGRSVGGLAVPPSSRIVAEPGPANHAENGLRSTERSSGASAIDFEGLAETLLRKKHILASKLVKFMKDRTVATFQDVMDNVYGGERDASTVRTLINRANNALYGLESRLRFSTQDCQVIRHVDPE